MAIWIFKIYSTTTIIIINFPVISRKWTTTKTNVIHFYALKYFIEDNFGVELPPETLTEEITIAQLGARVMQLEKTEATGNE